jgi:RND family efflux transporter MFP subunit
VAAQAPGGKKGGGIPPASVAIAVVQERPIADSRSFVGTLMPLKRSTVGSAVDGRVLEYPITEGDWVEKGQTLCQLLTRTAEIEVAAAQAELKLRQQEYEELKAGSRPEEISRAKAKLEEARALQVFTKDKLARTQRLFNSNSSASREQLDQVTSEATAAEQLFLAAQADLQLAEQGPRQEKILQAQARMESAQEQVNLLNDRLEKYTIKAPFDGYVVAEGAEEGQWIQSGDVVAEVIAIDPIDVTVGVPEQYIAGLQAAVADFESRQEVARADVLVDAFGPQPFAGEVVRIVPQADLRSRTFPVKVRLPNPLQGRSHALKAGMLAHVTLPTGQETPGTLVPKDALILGGASPRILVVVTDPQSKQQVAKEVVVETGLSDGEWIQVKGDVRQGQQVVVRGNERIRDGQPVQVISTGSTASK